MKNLLRLMLVVSFAAASAAHAQSNPPFNQSDFVYSGNVKSVDFNADCHLLDAPDGAIFGASGGCSENQKTFVRITVVVVNSSDDFYKPGDTYYINVVNPGSQSALKKAGGNPNGDLLRVYNKEDGFCSADDSYIITNKNGGWVCSQ